MSRLSDDFRKHGSECIDKLDEAAKAYDGPLPELVIDALAMSSALAVSHIEEFHQSQVTLKLLLAVGKSVYRTAYANGRRDAQAQLGVGEG